MPRHAVPSQSQLRQQKVDHNGPGSILRDFQTLLEFIGPEGIRATGKYHLLPINRLAELSERMTHPFRPGLSRPQLRSFPHLHGLYLLLRSTGLGVAEESGKKKGRLSFHPALLEMWQQLNPTEQYFNLLAAWLHHASFEMTQDSGSPCLDDAMRVLGMVKALSKAKDSSRFHMLSYYGNQTDCTLALMELFGLMEVEARLPERGSHMRAKVWLTAFGDELFELLLADFSLLTAVHQEGTDLCPWQTVVQEYFPEWQRNLELPEPDFRDGLYQFKVSWGKTWRRIVIPGESDLDELSQAIIAAYQFDGDHLYEFRLRDEQGRRITVAHPAIEDTEFTTDEFSIGYLPLAAGESMEFLYDFGTCWLFKIKLESIAPSNNEVTQATLVQSHGESPPEYDDEW